MKALARLRPQLASERGITLVELITVLAILGIVLAGIMTVFVAGIRAEVDMNERFQAQQEARLALSSLRKDIRSACWTNATTTVSATVALGYCTGPSPTPTSQVTWCAAALGTSRFGLFRQSGTSCGAASGMKRADRLTSNAIFSLNTTSGSRPRLQISLPVDANPARTGGSYLLEDTIMLRNAPTTP